MNLSAGDIRRIGEQLKHHEGAAFRKGLPTPRLRLSFIVLRALEAHLLQIVFESTVRVGVRQNLKIDDDIDVERTRMRGHLGRLRRDQIAWRQAAY